MSTYRDVDDSKLVDDLSEGIHNNKCLDCESCLILELKMKN